MDLYLETSMVSVMDVTRHNLYISDQTRCSCRTNNMNLIGTIFVKRGETKFRKSSDENKYSAPSAHPCP